MSQLEWVEKQLRRGRKVTPLDALKGCGCFRLAPRILELRRAGLKVRTVRSKQKRFAEYSL